MLPHKLLVSWQTRSSVGEIGNSVRLWTELKNDQSVDMERTEMDWGLTREGTTLANGHGPNDR